MSSPSTKNYENLKIELKDIHAATDNFNDEKIIGSGGFGKVYKGVSKEHGVVAIKRLDRKYGQGDPEFLKEIQMLSDHSHESLISLHGYCDEAGEKVLVYEFADNGSLDRHLSSTSLSWIQRIKICIDAARGLSYLHNRRVIHRDVKSANILLNGEWNAKISDMGLSTRGPANLQNSALYFTNPVGTIGYVDPVYLKTRKLTKESDVYSFGIVLMEVLCGRLLCAQNIKGTISNILQMWTDSFNNNKLTDIIHKNLWHPLDTYSLETISDIANKCILPKEPKDRPTMSHVVDELKRAFRIQEQSDLNQTEYNVLKKLLADVVLLNGGNTRLSINNKTERIQFTSIKECLVPDRWGDDGDRYSHRYNSSFKEGTYNTCGESFRTRVTTILLSPSITYTANLIFKCPDLVKQKTAKQQYISLVYELKEGEKKISVVHLANKGEDEWLSARLLQFTTSDQSTLDLEILFRSQEYSLQIEGIEFQPVLSEFLYKYQGIVKSAEPPLFYTDIDHLKEILSEGIHLNGGDRWFYLNDKEQHCEMISIKHCLIPDAGENYPYISKYNSRFSVGTCFALDFRFKIRVRAQFLTRSITYSVNLVFKFYNERNLTKQPNVLLKYKLQGQTKTSVSYLAKKREDEWWMVELCHFASQGTMADLEIIIEDNHPYIVVDGIEFLPVELEKAEHQVLKDKNVDDDNGDMQPRISSLSDSDLDTQWEQKLPIGYEDIIRLAKHSLSMITTKKELYSILTKGFLINSGQEWLSLDKNGKKCLMLSPRTAIHAYDLKWQSSPESRFKELVKLYLLNFGIVSKIKSQVLESETTYATYLVYKLPESDQSKFETLVKVMDGKDLDSDDDWEKADYWNITLVSPQIPVIVSEKVDENTRNPANIPKVKGIPQQRSDGWMEVQVYEFQTDTTTEFIPVCLRLRMYNKWFDGLSVQGIEFRPIYIG